MNLQQQVTATFEQRFGSSPTIIIRAPGRVNLIGEHTDYNDGFVLPMAIDRAAWVALRPRNDREVRVYSIDYDEQTDFSLNHFEKSPSSWVDYLKAIAWVLADAGYQSNGWEGVVIGDVPIGAGLSSSAALELAFLRAFAVVSDHAWEPSKMALLAQRAENKWVGVNCGIMDQMISAAGQEGHALLIDCRSLETRLAPLPQDTMVIILDTSTRRGLVDSAYNERREQCETAARFFGVPALRDVNRATFEAQGHALDEITRRRARHIISENERTLHASEAMNANDPITLGNLMNASHDSLRDDFEVSNDALNAMVTIAKEQPGCYGARMTGAGFGGCAVALVAVQAVNSFSEEVSRLYQQRTGLQPAVYVCHAANGAEVISGG